MPSVDLDQEFLELFFNVTSKPVPAEIDLACLKSQLIEIVDVMKDLNKNAKKPVQNLLLVDEEDPAELTNNAILVVDDLGVITYQLRMLLSQFEIDVDCSQEIYDAVNKYKKRQYKYVIMDLFIPTEREGFILLAELKKMAKSYNTDTVVGVITASPRKEIEIQCKKLNADFFLEKSNDWQKQLSGIMQKIINENRGEEDLF